jgi:hypothetical protein
MHWGDRHRPAKAGPPRLTRHRQCGGPVRAGLACEACGRSITPAELEVLPGPGLRTTHRSPVPTGW